MSNGMIDRSLNYLADFVNNYSDFVKNSSDMAGTIKMFAGSVAPAGWLICDGSAVSRTEYARLFAAIGTTYGEGDGSTTFNLPDLRGRTAIGVGTGTASTSTEHALGQNNGQETHTLTQAQLPVVTGYVDTRMTGANGAATYFNPTGVFSHSYSTPASDMSTLSFTTGIKKSDRLSFSMGSGQAHNNMQPYLAVNYIICTGKDFDTAVYSLDLISEIKTGTAVTIAASARNTFYIDVAKEGYTPLGIGQVNMTGNSTVLARIASFGMTSDEKVWITVLNGSSSSQTWTPNVVVIYKGLKIAPANPFNDPVSYVNDYTMMMNRLLEMSVNPWSSGTCNVTGASNYNVFMLYTANGEALLGIRNDSNKIDLFGVYTTSANTTHYTKASRVNAASDSWSFAYNIKSLGHGSAGNHGTIGADEGIIKIIGLIPKKDAIADIPLELNTPMVDYIISQGSESNGWSWRKWNSGKLEQWGLIQQTNKSGTAFGNMYYATYTGITYPIPFVNTPALTVTPYGGTMGILGNITHTKTGITQYDMYRTNAGVVGGTVSCYATGTWK